MNYCCAFIILILLCGVVKADNLALLSGTLRTYQKAGCDDEIVTLKCPPGTSISIELAQYGKSDSSKMLCGTKSNELNTKSSYNYNITCLLSNALQYSLLQTVVEACQKKHQCKFKTLPKTFGGDPCPEIRKYVEIAYKCRPYEFRTKMACENEKIQLKCNPNSRVAIYSASFGRTEYESIKCPQPQGVPEETCLASYATETVLQLCHGKRSCELSADISTFGSPCRPHSRMYLKVVYTCVPRKVLKEQFEVGLEIDEIEFDENYQINSDDFDLHNIEKQLVKESLAVSSTSTNTIENSDNDNNKTRDYSKKLKDSPTWNKLGFENQERFYLYLILSVCAAILLCLAILVSRLLIQKYRLKRDAKFHKTNVSSSHSLPNGFNDDISEVDADIDLTITHPPPPPPPFSSSVAVHSSSPQIEHHQITELIRPHTPHHSNTTTNTMTTGHSHHMLRRNLNDLPKSLNNSTYSNFYYG